MNFFFALVYCCILTSCNSSSLDSSSSHSEIEGGISNSYDVKTKIVNSNVFDWNTYHYTWREQKINEKDWLQKLKLVDWQGKSELETIVKSNLKSLHFLDITNDQEKDIVYHGESGGESLVTLIFHSTGTGFRLCFESYGEVICGIHDDNNSIRILTFTEPIAECSDEYIFSYKLQNDEWVKEEQVILLNGQLVFPSAITHSKYYTVDTDSYNVRFSPKIDNEIKENIQLKGNVVGVISRGGKVQVLHENNGEDGRTWCFIKAINTSEKTQFSECLYSHDTFKRLEVYGWVSKRFLAPVDK